MTEIKPATETEIGIARDSASTGQPISAELSRRILARLDAERARAEELADARDMMGRKWADEKARADAAEAFIRNLVDMQSGGRWSRAVIREAAADFLRGAGRPVSGGKDTSPAFVLAAEQRARAEAAEAKLAKVREEVGSLRFREDEPYCTRTLLAVDAILKTGCET